MRSAHKLALPIDNVTPFQDRQYMPKGPSLSRCPEGAPMLSDKEAGYARPTTWERIRGHVPRFGVSAIYAQRALFCLKGPFGARDPRPFRSERPLWACIVLNGGQRSCKAAPLGA